MLFTPEINVKYTATCSNSDFFTFMALDNKVPTLAKITNPCYNLNNREDVFICPDGTIREVVKTVFINVADETKNETIHTPGYILPNISVKSVTYVYTPKAGQVWSILKGSNDNILILDDTKWPLKCVICDTENIKNHNYMYLGHDMKLYINNVPVNAEYCDPMIINSFTNTCYILDVNVGKLTSFKPELNQKYYINSDTMVIFTNTENFPMEFVYTTSAGTYWVDPIGKAYSDKECTVYANQFIKLEPVVVNDMVDCPKQFGEYEFMFDMHDSTTYKVVMTTKDSFKYLNGTNDLIGKTRTIKNGNVYSSCNHGKIKTSKFIRMMNEMVDNPIVNGIYDIVYSDGDVCRVVLTSKSTADDIFVRGTFKYVKSGVTRDFDKNGAVSNTMALMVGSMFIEMKPVVNWEDQLKTIVTKENEYREQLKELEQKQDKVTDEYKKASKMIDDERSQINENMNSLWEKSESHKQFKTVCKFLFTSHSLDNKKYYLGGNTLVTSAKEYLLKTLEKQLEITLFHQQTEVLGNIEIVKGIPTKE